MMKREHYLRNFVLLAIGAAGLAMLVPSEDGTTATQAQLSSLAPSPALSNYLEARLRPPSPPMPTGRREAGLGDTVRGPQPATERTPVAAPVATASVVEAGSRSTTAVNVRAGPDGGAARLFVLPPRASVRIDEVKGNWARILTADGKSGWVYSAYLEPIEGDDRQLTVGAPAIESAAVPAPKSAAVGDEPKSASGHTADPQRDGKKAKAYRLGNAVVLRSSPSKGSERVTVLQRGARVSVAEWDGSWARVILSDGTSGWINAR